uniref:uncharacterized protein n=1 Tax=Myxine glutinosa TaxID=7769 RepID=UPI00358E16B7
MMFWGLKLEHGKLYSQEVSNDFHLTMAALDPASADENVSKESVLESVVLRVKGADHILCTLEHGKTWQHPLDLIFSQGEKVCFFIEGSGSVHLTGYYLGEDDLDNVKQVCEEVNDKDEGVEEEEEVDEEEEEEEEEEVTMQTTKEVKTPISVVNGKRHTSQTSNQIEPKRLKEIHEEKHRNGAVRKEAKANESQKPGKAEKQLNTMKGKQNTQTPEVGRVVKGKLQGSSEMTSPRLATTQEDKKSKAAGVQQVLRGGTVIEDLIVGKGQRAKKGKEVAVYYCGKLKNGTVFDSLNVGKGFVFRLGVGEVIPGWDVGLSGMLLGGKRRLIVPPTQGYGNKRVGPIPKNSTLIFEVELKNVK